MSEGLVLYLFLWFFYLADCILWLGKQSVAFVSLWGNGWRVQIANALYGNSRGGLLLMNPIPPLGRVFLCHLFPVSFSPMGICAYNLQSLHGVGWPFQTGNCYRFDDITEATTDEKYIRINNQKFVKCATAGQAVRISEFINEIKQASYENRDKLISTFLDTTFNKDKAEERMKVGLSEIACYIAYVKFCLFTCLYLFLDWCSSLVYCVFLFRLLS